MSPARSWEGGSTRAWRTVRARVLARNKHINGGRCTLAIHGVCTGEADTVHHTLGRAVTGDDPAFLAAVCQPCNLHVGEPARSGYSITIEPKTITDWEA